MLRSEFIHSWHIAAPIIAGVGIVLILIFTRQKHPRNLPRPYVQLDSRDWHGTFMRDLKRFRR